MEWERLNRSTVYRTPYLEVFEDTVRLPNGHVVNDYSVIGLRDGVVIVATDNDDRLITIKEYKYAINKQIVGLPAGGIEDGDTPEKTAEKELLEETGYGGADNITTVAAYHEYPSKLTHTTYVVRMEHVKRVAKAAHEATESIADIACMPISEVSSKTFSTAVNVAALAACGII